MLDGEDYQVSYALPNYGLLPVARGKLPKDGKTRSTILRPAGRVPMAVSTGSRSAASVWESSASRTSRRDRNPRCECPYEAGTRRMPARPSTSQPISRCGSPTSAARSSSSNSGRHGADPAANRWRS